MGQYYKVRIFDEENKNEVIISESDNKNIGNGKLMEFVWLDSPVANTISEMIYNHTQRVACVGDYVEIEECDFRNRVWESKGVKPRENIFKLDNKYIINHTKKEYIDFNEYFSINTVNNPYGHNYVCKNPIPILTAKGNSRGGGDFYGYYMELAGSWFDHLISIEDIPPEGYDEICPQFKEFDEDEMIGYYRRTYPELFNLFSDLKK